MSKEIKPTLAAIEACSGYKFVPLKINFLATNICDIEKRYKNANNLALNHHGKNFFCKFAVDGESLSMKGIYLFLVNGEVKYLGKTIQTFKKRFSGTGYGGISPRNCFVGGQSTNCKLNAQMNQWYAQGVVVEIYTTNSIFASNKKIDELELMLLNSFDFELNKQHN